jgi:hypothetical protein
MKPPAVHDDHADLVRDVVALAEDCAGEWFEQFGGPGPSVTLVTLSVRPRCFLYRFALTQRSSRREIVAKVRHSDPRPRRAERYLDRPELTPQRTMPDGEAAHLEYEGLKLIESALEGTDPARFGVVRALGELPDRATVVMEYVDQPTLRQLLARPRGRARRDRDVRVDDRVWAGLGEWLRRFHVAHPGRSMPDRMTRGDDLAGQFDLSSAFLVRAGVDSGPIRALAAAAGRRLDQGPSELPSAVGHGDFTSQNVFVAADGRVTIFDPLPAWRVCVFEDLARLTMGLRLLGPQTLTRGRLFQARDLDRWESHLLGGYSAGAGPPLDLLHAYQAALLLDRWGELVSKRPARGLTRRGVRKVRVRAAAGWFEREARRLTALLS